MGEDRLSKVSGVLANRVAPRRDSALNEPAMLSILARLAVALTGLTRSPKMKLLTSASAPADTRRTKLGVYPFGESLIECSSNIPNLGC